MESIQEHGFTDEIYEVAKSGNRFNLFDVNGNKVGTQGINTGSRKRAFEEGMALRAYITKSGKTQYRRVPYSEFEMLKSTAPLPSNPSQSHEVTEAETPQDHEELQSFIHQESVGLKPQYLVLSELKWKYLIRSAVRAKNILMLGASGSGKTLAAKSLSKALGRESFIFNLGSSQDPRATLVGNTQFDSSKGTFFAQSAFVRAIQTPNAVILLDELSRAHPEAWNILMTVLDEGQRYLRLDEKEGSPTVDVAEGVTFIATANVGTEYTSTRVMDRAIRDRFVTIEMDLLNAEEEYGLLKYMYPEAPKYELTAISEIASETRKAARGDDQKLTTILSTRGSVEAAGLIYDGFSLMEAAEIAIFPVFSEEGGVDSERTYVKQIVQKYQQDESQEELYPEQPPEELSASSDPTQTINW